MKAVVVYNPRAGNQLSLDELEQKCNQVNIDIIKSIDIQQSGAENLNRYKDNPDIYIIGYGGDGTLSSIASRLVDTQSVFIPLAGGTLNHFTKDLGIDQNIDTAIKNVTTANIHQIDVGLVNNQCFINNSSIGLYPSALSERTRLQSVIGKWPAALAASIKAFIRFKLYTVTINDESFQTPFVFIGNNLYDSNRFMTRTSLDKGLLSVYVIRSARRSTLLKVFLYGLVGKSSAASELNQFQTKKVTIEVNRPEIRVSYDGESQKMTPPLTYEIKHHSLRVLC